MTDERPANEAEMSRLGGSSRGERPISDGGTPGDADSAPEGPVDADTDPVDATDSADDDETNLEVRVEGARKRDAGRGIARLPDHVQSKLGVLSGDPIILEGDRLTVAKVWPGEDNQDIVRIDADTRSSIGANIGEYVTVRTASVEPATAVTIQPVGSAAEEIPSAAAIREILVDRLVRPGKQLHIDGGGPFVVTETSPIGSVRLSEETEIDIDPEPTSLGDEGESRSGDRGDGRAGTTYEDIGGLDSELELVREMIELPLSEPEVFADIGIDPPSGVLMHGPPGTGKTLIARAVANEVDAHFEVIHGPEVVSKYKGESEERLREVFETAAANEPAIIFIDELDSIAGTRDEGSDMENRVVAQLLTLLDGLDTDAAVLVIGATNRVEAIDPALRRGGRFDREIEIGVPDAAGRLEILHVHTRDMPLADDVDRTALADSLHGFVGADIGSLAREAGMAALRRRDRTGANQSAGATTETSLPRGTEEGVESGPEPGAAEREERTAGAGADEGVDARTSAETTTGAQSIPVTVTREDFETALTAVEPSGMREYVAESPNTTFGEIGGLDATISRLREAIEWPLSYDPLFEAAAADPPSGVLLFGPPGTGKTVLAEAIAGESGVNFVRVAGPEILDRYVGESEQAIRDLFERARQTAPAIVFLDEIDAIASRRGEGHDVTQRVVSQLLTELDRAASHPNLVVLAATNRKDHLDPALLRPGRFEQHIEVPAPDEEARREILAVHTANTPLGESVDLDEIASRTAGYSGADLASLVREASMRAIRDVAEGIDPSEAEAHRGDVTVEQAHITAALETLDSRERPGYM